MAKVNLDALILREDFRATTAQIEPPTQLGQDMMLNMLANDTIRGYLRKPDFQRETADWTPEQVSGLVQSFLEGDLIPSVILWRSPENGNIFVIDGAHRLSALIAWANDDYGDSHDSYRFFEGDIPQEQKRAASQTRKLISESVGSYHDLQSALRNQDTVNNRQSLLARTMNILAIKAQWVQGNADKAESSFFRINQKATQIDPTELEMIQARRKPNALAARAIIRGGTGHKYWDSFHEEIQREIERLGKEVNELVTNTLQSPDLPLGRASSTANVRMIFDFVNSANRPPGKSNTKSPAEPSGEKEPFGNIPDDSTGDSTVEYLKSVRRAALLLSSKDPSSLGLHPGVYFFTATGNSHPAAFLAAVQFTQELRQSKVLMREFCSIRRNFEDFLVDHKYFLNQIIHQYGSRGRAVRPIVTLYRTIFDSIRRGQIETDSLIKDILHQEGLRKLKQEDDSDEVHGKDFSRETKKRLQLESSLKAADRCPICGARIHIGSITVDHKVRKQDGGTGAPSNGQLTHPYCNSGVKEYAHSAQLTLDP